MVQSENPIKDLYENSTNGYLRDNTSNLLEAVDVRNAIYRAINEGYAQRGIDLRDYGCQYSAVGLIDVSISADGRTISSPNFKFNQTHVGMSAWVDINKTEYTIESITNADGDGNGDAVLDADCGLGGQSPRRFFCGYDYTDKINQALEDGAKNGLTALELGDGTEEVSFGAHPIGTPVIMTPGFRYLIHNSQADYDAGKASAIVVPRHGGLVGAGSNHNGFIMMPDNKGFGVANKSVETRLGDEHILMQGFDIIGNRFLQSSGCLDNFAWRASFANQTYYTNVDARCVIYDISSKYAYRHGMVFGGRGENFFSHLHSINAAGYGVFIDNLQDTRIDMISSAASGLTGLRIKGGASCLINNLKVFFAGGSGGSNEADSAGIFIDRDGSDHKKGALEIRGEVQETRGSNLLMTTGNCKLNLKLSDAGRTTLGSQTNLPNIIANIHLKDQASYNVFDSVEIRPEITQFVAAPEFNRSGDYGVYIENTCQGNKGQINTNDTNTYGVSKLGGDGITNRKNTRLTVDGEYFISDRPGRPTNIALAFVASGNTRLTFTPPASDGGREIINYNFYYKLSADSEFTQYYGASFNTSNVSFDFFTDSETYDFYMEAVNANGTSQPTAIQQYTAIQTVPDQVTGLKAFPQDGAVLLQWDAPFDGGGAITDYVIQQRVNNPQGSWVTIADGTNTNTSYIVTGLTNGTALDFRVAATNGVGTGTYSAAVTQTPVADNLSLFSETSLLGYYDSGYTSTITDTSNAVDTWGCALNVGDDITGTGTSRPLTDVATVFGRNAIEYDGLDDALTLPSSMNALTNGDFTIFVIFEFDTGSTTKQNGIIQANTNDFILYARGDAVNNDFVAKAGSGSCEINNITFDTNPHMIILRKSGTTLTMYYEGRSASATASNFTTTSIEIGRVNQFFGQLEGRLPVFLAYDEAFSNADLNEKANGLATRYNVSHTDVT